MDKIQELQARLAELHDSSAAIQAKADTGKRDLTSEERAELDRLSTEFDDVSADLERLQKVQAQAARLSQPANARLTEPDPLPQPHNALPKDPAARPRQPDGLQNTRMRTQDERQRWGFSTAGDYYMAVKNAVLSPSNMDPRLIQNATLSTYGSEGVGADGGFAVPPEWRSEIMNQVAGDGSLLALCDQQPVTGNTITFPVDETTAWGTTGIQAYWDSEGATINQSKPVLKELQIRVQRLTALVPVTEELLEDAPAMSSYITGKAGEKLTFKVNDAIINGTGAGQPLGIMNAPVKVAVAKGSSQVKETVHSSNIAAMIGRMPQGSFGRSTWLCNQDVIPQILQLGFPILTVAGAASGGGAMYLPPNGLANAPAYGTLMGRPIFVTEACATLGTEGDIILADMSRYLAVVKGGIRSDVSMHLWFDQNTTAFRFVLRMNGQPWMSSAISRAHGSNTLSHFVTIAVRG